MSYEMEKTNLKFIDLVKKHECIWNRDAETFNEKSAVDKAWNKIAKEMGDTSKTCLSHWQTIRRTYRKSCRPNNQKSEYYLSSALEFARPHLNIHPADNDKKEDTISNDTDDSRISFTEIEIKEEPYNSEGAEVCTSENNVEKILFETIKSEDDTENKHKLELDTTESSCNKSKKGDDSIEIERKKPKETIEADKDVHPNSGLIEANRRFFESLIPFVDEMNTQQNRRFRREIMCLIDDVLDDKDLNGENISSS